MGGGPKGKKGVDPPIQKGGGSITKKKPDSKSCDSATKPRKQKSARVKGDLADDDALIASLISCAAGCDKPAKNDDRPEDLDMELVAALAAEACLPSRHGGCDSRWRHPACSVRQAVMLACICCDVRDLINMGLIF